MSLRRMTTVYMREMLAECQATPPDTMLCPRIKVSGITSMDDILVLNRALPDMASFLIDFPSSRHHVSRSMLEDLIFHLDPRVCAVGAFIDQPLGLVSELADTVLDMVELCGNEGNPYIVFLRELVDIPICQAIRLDSEEAVVRANESKADIVLLGCGKDLHDPVPEHLVAQVSRPYILAGPTQKSIGALRDDPIKLQPGNLFAEMQAHSPWALSLLDGVEDESGVKSLDLIVKAIDEAKRPEYLKAL